MEIRGEAGGVVECGLRNIVDVVLQSLVRDPGNVNQIRMELSRRQIGKHPLRWPTDPMCLFDSQKAGAREQNAASDCTAPALSPLLSKTSL